MPHVAIGGRAVHYRLDGPEGAPVVAFSNALGSDLGLWEGVMPRLAARYRCLRYDTRGHGGSQACDAPVTIEALAGDLAGLENRRLATIGFAARRARRRGNRARREWTEPDR